MRELKNGLTGKQQKDMINAYLLNAVYFEESTVSGIDSAGNIVELPVICNTDKDKVNFVMSRFESEYDYEQNIKLYPNRQERFAQWLMGLPSTFNIDYANHKIIELAKLWGLIPNDATEREEDKIIANWFNWIAAKFLQLHFKLNK